MQIAPYLHFGGNCEEALTYYVKVFGGEVTTLMRWAEGPHEMQAAPEYQDWVMHACLTIGKACLMASDSTPDHFVPQQGVSVSIDLEDFDKAKATFDALGDGGSVWMEFAPTFWSKGFGMLTDRFGTQWMIGFNEGGGA